MPIPEICNNKPNRFWLRLRDWRLIPIVMLMSIIGLSACLQACGPQFSLKQLIPMYKVNWVSSIEIVSAIDANQNSAVAVDVVFVHDEDLLGELKKLNERDWFKRKHEFQLNHPVGLNVISWEVVPASRLQNNHLPDKHWFAKGVLLFAFFINSQKAHRADITKLKSVKIFLEKDGFRLDQESFVAPTEKKTEEGD